MNNLIEFKNYLLLNLGKKTAFNYEQQMKGFFIHYPELTQQTLNEYLSSKIDKWSGGSYNAFYKAIKWYFKYTKNILELPKFKKVERKPRPYLKEKDIQEILNKCNVIFEDYQKAQCVLETLFITGIRPKELLNLKRKNINIEERQIILEDTKTFKSRTVFLTPSLAKKILCIFEREPEKENAFNLNETTISYYCKTIEKHLNIKFNAYMCRHSFAHLYLKKSGNDLIGLASTLGHEKIETSRIYSEVNDEERQIQFDKIFKEKK